MFPSFNSRAAGLDLDARQAIDLAARAGFGGVDLLVRDILDAGTDPRTLRAEMDDLGLRGGAFPLPINWRGGADEFANGLNRLPYHAEAAAILGVVRTGTWVMPETPGTDPSLDVQATTLLHMDRIGKMARVLEGFGIRLGLEVIGVASSRTGRGRPFVTRLADLDRVLGEAWKEAPNLGILVDAFHLHAAGESIEAGLAWGVERIVWVHLADLPSSAGVDRAAIQDSRRGLPGEHGAVESRRLLHVLALAGYDGPVTAEPMTGCDSLANLSNEESVTRIAESLRSVWPNPPSKSDPC